MVPTSRRMCLLIPGAKLMLTRAPVNMAPLILFPTVPMVSQAVKGITVILRTGSDSQGFSLLELLLVLLLLGLSSLIVLPTIDTGLRERDVRRSALGLAAVARELRSRAVYEGIPQQLVLNVVDHSYLVARDREVHLPSDVKFSQVEGGQTLEAPEAIYILSEREQSRRADRLVGRTKCDWVFSAPRTAERQS